MYRLRLHKQVLEARKLGRDWSSMADPLWIIGIIGSL